MSLANDLRERARIRLSATCRGDDDRLAAQLAAAADAIEDAEAALQAERAAHAKTGEVLEFYADPASWSYPTISPEEAARTWAARDRGHRAATRLREIGEA